MDKRNPSRAGKSELERRHLYQTLKGISSPDTAPAETPFEPSNVVSNNETSKKSTKNRPQPIKRKILNHLKKNSATYITTFIILIFGLAITPPYFNLNREVGEVKIEVKNIKDSLSNETNTSKQQFSKLFEEVSDLLNKLASIRTYLLNRFGAKL